ncbi:MAG: alpha-amylase [Lachnospiraceae bacterium]|nr:alpha-amylase [Lachnospiraceae bacterium]
MKMKQKRTQNERKSRTFRAAALLLALAVLISGCSGKKNTAEQSKETAAAADLPAVPEAVPLTADDKYRTTYEIFVGSFADSNGDGVGDLPGILSQIDYINDGDPAGGADLGFTGIWTTPVFPSPTYHKYDVTDYKAIDPQFGTMEDFESLLAACHERGMTWILDLPINHTSVEHPWFKEAVSYLTSLAPDQEPVFEDCPYVWYYRFAEEQYEGYVPLGESGITDDPSGRWFYEARFWSGMPDLNLDTEEVRAELTDIMKFWIDKGIDGFRLDAVTSYHTANAEANIDFLTWLTDTGRSLKPDIYFVGEAWENQNVYAEYYRSGIDSLFDFAFANAEGIVQKTANGKKSAAAFAEALAEEEELYAEFNENYINAPFYTNHDMARSAGFYTKDAEPKIKLAGALNLLMTGNAFVYYGEELGMKGSGKDENKRAPMQWIGDGQAAGQYDYLTKYMCSGPADMEKFSMPYPPFSEQLGDPFSIWNYYRQAVALRNHYPAIARGRTVPVTEMSDDNICAMIRRMDGESEGAVLIVINTSPESASVQLSGEGGAFKTLGTSLGVSEEAATLENGLLHLPGYGIAVLE